MVAVVVDIVLLIMHPSFLRKLHRPCIQIAALAVVIAATAIAVTLLTLKLWLPFLLESRVIWMLLLLDLIMLFILVCKPVAANGCWRKP